MIRKWDIYSRKYVSLNDYKSKSWRVLKNKIDPLKSEFALSIKAAKIPPLSFMELYVYHNTRLDMDNIVGSVKPFVDCLRAANVLIDDTAKQWDKLCILYDPTMKRGVTRFHVVGEPIKETKNNNNNE